MSAAQSSASLVEPLSADQRIEREIEFLASVAIDVRDLPAQRLAELADHHAELANGCVDAAHGLDGRERLTILWLGGHHAVRARVYGEAARAA
jgi:hypothetical protein